MILFARNRCHVPSSTSKVDASAGTQCDREYSRMGRAWPLSRCFLGLTAIAALAACGGAQVSLNPISAASAATTTSNQVVVTHPAPLVTLAASPASISSNGSSTLTWTASNADQCNATGGWHGQVATSGRWSTGNLSNTTEYELTCKGPGGFATQSATVTVSAPFPVVTLQAIPSSLRPGGSSVLTWSSQNTTSCTASDGWSGTKAVSGSQSTGPLKADSTYMLRCTGSGGSAFQTATVSVGSSAPTVSLSASPSTLAAGSSSTLKWSSVNATACTASGGWSGSRALSGAQSSGALTNSATYTLSCIGPGGNAAQSTTVSVVPPLPTVALSVGPSAIASGASATLTWSSTHATACSASGAWSGAKPISGSSSTGALTANASYTLSCTGPGGNAAQTATVAVKQSAPTVSLSASPSSITSGKAASLIWSSTQATACTASGAWSGVKAISGSTSTGALTANATYTLSCTGLGGNAVQSATVTVTATPTATVSISASPSTIASGAASTLSWSSSNATSCSASGAWSGAKAISGSQSTGALKANATYSLTCTGTGGGATQSTTVSVSSAAPTVALAASPSTIASGNSAVLTWSSTNATVCTASGGWSGAKAISGSQSTGALKASGTYLLTCTGTGGSATQAAQVSVTSPTPAPTVNLAANPSSIENGKTSTLSWSSTNATVCTATGAWSGTKAISGSQSTAALTSSVTYTLTCTGTGGSAAQTSTITVTSPAPTVSFSSSPSTVAKGGSSTLSWSSTNATSCTASGGWSGAEAISGTHSTGALTANATYTLTCTGSGGSAAQSAAVTVATPAPAVTLTANPSTVASGAASTLTWSAANATSCAATGAWSGSEAASGSQKTAALTATARYTLTCTGAGGSAAQSVTVTVAATTGTATLAWAPPTTNTNGTAVTPLSGYTIYYGTSATSLTKSVVVSSSTTSYTMTGLAAGTWYFAMAADASDGTQSAMSNIGSKAI